MTMEDAVAIALRRNHDAIAARLDIEAAQLDLVAGRPLPNPVVSYTVGNLVLGAHNRRWTRPSPPRLLRPDKLDELSIFLGRALDELQLRREACGAQDHPAGSASRSRRHRQEPAHARRARHHRAVADTDAPLLLTGETGTGKGLLARAGAYHEPPPGRPLIAVNCAALTRGLCWRAALRHVKGAFTGATKNHPGISARPPAAPWLLGRGRRSWPCPSRPSSCTRWSGARCVRWARPGSSPSTCAFMAATHRDCTGPVRGGSFHQDLFYAWTSCPSPSPRCGSGARTCPTSSSTYSPRPAPAIPTPPCGACHRGCCASSSTRLPGNVRELAHAIERGRVCSAAAPRSSPATAPGGGRGRRRRWSQLHRDNHPIREIPAPLPQRGHSGSSADTAGRTAERLGVDGKTLAKWLSDEGE